MINYEFLAKSITYFEKEGYQRVESPWLVSKAISHITKPPEAEDYIMSYAGKSKAFVASGEQSFLYLINKGFLPAGAYQTVTPCMRYESFDDYHTKYFMKNELIDFAHPDHYTLLSMIEKCLKFFESLAMSIDPDFDIERIQRVRTSDDSFDIEFDGIEIGSYGIRECNFVRWCYGTAIAEPRFSRLIENKLRKNTIK